MIIFLNSSGVSCPVASISYISNMSLALSSAVPVNMEYVNFALIFTYKILTFVYSV